MIKTLLEDPGDVLAEDAILDEEVADEPPEDKLASLEELLE